MTPVRDVLTEYLNSNKKDIQKQIENIKSAYLRGRISKTDFGFQRQRIDIKLELLRDLAQQAGIDWETL